MSTKWPKYEAQISHSVTVNFHEAIQQIASIVGAAHVNEEGTTISAFRAQPSTVLERAEQGHVEVITRKGQKFVILSADQVFALADNAATKSKKTMAELYPNLPFLPDSSDRPRYIPLPDTVDHLRPRQ